MFCKDKEMFLLLFLWCCSVLIDALREKHSLLYKFTALTKADTFPEFSAVGVCDDRRIKHFSDEERVWILTEDNWTEAPDPPDDKDWFIDQLKILTNCSNSQCSDHALLRKIGCELERLPDGSVNRTVFDEYGFDGEDFISFNSDTMTWIDKNPKAKETKVKWDLHTEHNKHIKYFLKTCIDWISRFNNTKQSSPDVHVSARKAPDDHCKLVLTCLATGFYPRDVQMDIRLNRIKLEGQTSSGIRPNEDETFQRSISVKIDCKRKGSYDCLVNHIKNQSKPFTVKWDGMCSNCETEPPWDVIGGAVAVLVLAVICCFIYKKRSSNDSGQSTTSNQDEAARLTSLHDDPMTRRPSYGSMKNHSHDDPLQEDPLQNDQSEDDPLQEDQSQNDQSEDEQ